MLFFVEFSYQLHINFILTRNFPSPFNQSSQVHAFSFFSIPCRLSLLPPNDNGIFPSLSIVIEPFPLCPPTFDILTPSVHQPLLLAALFFLLYRLLPSNYDTFPPLFTTFVCPSFSFFDNSSTHCSSFYFFVR